MGGRLFAGRQGKHTSARLNSISKVQKERMVTFWETVQIRNENVSTILLTKAKLELKLSCVIPHAFASIGGTTTNLCIFTS